MFIGTTTTTATTVVFKSVINVDAHAAHTWYMHCRMTTTIIASQPWAGAFWSMLC